MIAPVTKSSSILISDHLAIEDADRCRDLWVAVLQRAVDDRDWIVRIGGKPRLEYSRSDHKRAIEMGHGGDPDEFLNGRYCHSICSMINLGGR